MAAGCRGPAIRDGQVPRRDISISGVASAINRATIRFEAALAVASVWRISTFLTHPWLVVASGTGGTKEHDTGVRLAAFEASAAGGGDAIVTGKN
jgi:hypothetical protein